MTADDEVAVVDLEALFDLEQAYGGAVAATVASYGAIATSDGARAGDPLPSDPVEAAVWALRIAAGESGRPAPEAVVERPRVRRLLVAHLLGDRLHRAVLGVGAPEADEAGWLASAPARVGRDGVEARVGGARGRAAVTWLPTAAALYLLARQGFTDLFDAVVGADAVEVAGSQPPTRSALIAEARARASLARR